jgi:phenylpyruvate tautomerase
MCRLCGNQNCWRAASRIAASHLGKPEGYMMVGFTPVGNLIFDGIEDSAAFLELRSIGVPDGKRNLLCAELTDLVAGICGISKEPDLPCNDRR